MEDFLDEVEPLVSEIRKQGLRRFEEKISSLVDQPWSELTQEIFALDRQLQKLNSWRVQDQPGAIYLKISCMLLALYRTLKPLFENEDDLLNIIQETIIETNIGQDMDAFLQDHFGISPDAPDDAWDTLCKNYIVQGSQRYGCNWVFEKGIKDQRRFFVNVRKCGFADFFLDHGARDLLYTLCASDYSWGDGLKKYNIQFERPTTLSEGSDACRFQFIKNS
ncbi:MAG: L-2-amino-thiazoline-4-carboxylic acid hydrolase [Desulfobacteraceae bacterium]|jgi:hypothetical protein